MNEQGGLNEDHMDRLEAALDKLTGNGCAKCKKKK